MMRALLAAAAILVLCPLPAAAQGGGYPDFELVETIPAGTNLDNPDIRDAHEVWLGMIASARRSLDIEQFYVSAKAGEPLDDILDAIRAAAARGVAVRIVVDARMHKTYPQPVDSLGSLPNIGVRVIDFGRLAGGVQHAKFFIVDGREIFLGSQNFDWRALKHIHELGVRIANEGAVRIYADIFDLDWKLAGLPPAAGGERRAGGDPALRPQTKSYGASLFRIPEGPGDTLLYRPTMSPKGFILDSLLWDETNIVALIDAAHDSVSCQFLTYTPVVRGGGAYTVLNDAFRRAAARGAHVRLIVSDWSTDHPTIDSLKALAATPNIEVRVSSIPEAATGYISFARVEHCKYLAADANAGWVGTANWEMSYFYRTRNLGVAIWSPTIGALLNRIFCKGWYGPYVKPVTAAGSYPVRQHGGE